MTIAEGCDAHFEVEVTNNDINTVQWEKNGVPIGKDDSRLTITSLGNIFSLVVRNVSKKDEATYRCIAGTAKSVARLYVEGRI